MYSTVKVIQLFGMIDIFYSKVLGIENISLSSTNPPGASRHTENKIQSNYFWLGGPAQYRVWLPLWLPGSHSDPSGFFPGTVGSSLSRVLSEPIVVSELSHLLSPLRRTLSSHGCLHGYLPLFTHGFLPAPCLLLRGASPVPLSISHALTCMLSLFPAPRDIILNTFTLHFSPPLLRKLFELGLGLYFVYCPISSSQNTALGMRATQHIFVG